MGDGETKSVIKRKKPMGEGKDAMTMDMMAEEETDITATSVGSEEIEMCINSLLQRIELFTQQVSDLLDTGKKLFKELSDKFEQKMICIHQEEVEKWTQEINDLRGLDSANEVDKSRLQNILRLLKDVHG